MRKVAFLLVGLFTPFTAFGEICFGDNNTLLPTLLEVERTIQETSDSLSDPEFGIGAAYYDLDEDDYRAIENHRTYQRWALRYKQSLLQLVSGNISGFREGLAALEEDLAQDRADEVLRLYNWAVELGVDLVDPAGFRKAFELATAGGAPNSIEPWEFEMIEVSLAYMNFDRVTLDVLINNPSAKGLYGDFVIGYANLLYARLFESKRHLESAIDVFANLELLLANSDSADESGCLGLWFGRVAVQNAEAYLLALTAKKPNMDRLPEALRQARMARHELELLLSPVLWGKAQRVTADLLAVAMENERHPVKREILMAARNRAYELSVMYR